MKRKIWCCAFLWLVLMLSGCGGKDEEAAAKSKEHIYRGETVHVEGIEDFDRLNDILVRGDRIYFGTYEWKDNGSTVLRYFSQKMDGTDKKTMTLEAEENAYYSYLTVDEEGNFYAILNINYEDDSNPDVITWVSEYFLVKLDGSGKEVWKQPLTGKDPDLYWVNQMLLLKDGRILLYDTDGIFLHDLEGGRIGEVKLQKQFDNGSIYQTADGILVQRSYNAQTSKEVLNKINVDTGEVSEDYMIPGGSGNYGMISGEGYDFYLEGNGSIYGYNLGDTGIKELMNFIDSDLVSYYITGLAVVNEKEFYGCTEDETGHTVLMKFSKVDPKDVKDKVVLTLGCSSFGWDLRSHVVEFNKTNEEYRIVVEDYSRYNTDEDYTLGQAKLNTDIASGKVPDILVITEGMPVDSYVSKGLFEDLYPYIDGDGEMKRENFFSNVLELYETDGKLYRMVPSFRVYTVAGKTADVGSSSGWTVADLRKVMAGKPEGTEIFVEMTREGMLNYGIQMSGSQFIDWKTGKCSFNSEDFIDLLELTAEFPEVLNDDYYSDNYWDTYDSFWRDGKVLLEQMYLTDFATYNASKKGRFGEDITLVGFPVREGNGAALTANLEMAMSSKSGQKDGVWQFMRYFLTDEYQEKVEYQWPISLKRVEELAQEAMKKPTYEDENGNMVETEQTYWIGGMEITITPMSREEADGLIEYVKSVRQLYAYNDALLKIVSEEAAPYFAGQKSAKEVADIIQSRVQIYVNENR